MLGFLFMLSGIISAQEKKEEKKIVVQALIEVTDEKGGAQGMDAIVFAKRQAEIMKSKAVLKSVVDSMSLARMWQMTTDVAVSKLERMLFFSVTEGGLIQLYAISKTDDMDLRRVLNTWIEAYGEYRRNRLKRTRETKVKFLQKAHDAQQDRLFDYRAKCAKMRKQFAVEKLDDYGKLAVGELKKLKAAEEDQAEEYKILQKINSELSLAERSLQKSVDFIVVHSKPFRKESVYQKTLEDMKHRLLKGEDRK